jgi:CubicO group peptidase (beta-lactamase class C family)
VSGPLGVADEIYFGMPQAEHHRLARLEDAPMPPGFVMPEMPPDLPMFKAGPMWTVPSAQLGNRADILSADIPAGGKTSARAIARMYAALLGEVDGVRLIPPQRLREATMLSMSGMDQVFGNPSSWALGFSLGRLGSTAQESPTVFGIGGFGGSFACGDTATGIAFAITKNRLTQDFDAATKISNIVTAALSKP